MDPQKRAVYDLLGVEGVRKEWGVGGVMREVEAEGKREGEGEVGVRAMGGEEFKRWFLGRMRERERRVVDSLVRCRVCISSPGDEGEGGVDFEG